MKEKKLMIYFIFSIGLFACPSVYVGYVGENIQYQVSFGGDLVTSKDSIKETPSKIYASYYGEKDEAREVKEADYETFKLSKVDVDYASDKNHVYYKGTILENIDPLTHEVISNGVKSDGFVLDKNGIYYYGQKLDGADPKSYKKNGYYIISNNMIFAKDKKIKYHIETFEVIISGQSSNMCDDLIRYGDTVVKDKNGVYVSDIKTGESGAGIRYRNIQKLNVDQETFKYSGGFLFEDKNNYYIARDGVAFLGRTILNKKESMVYSKVELDEGKNKPFMIVNNEKLYQLLYSYDYNLITKNKLNIKDMELYAVHYNIVLLKFGENIYTLTEEPLVKNSKVQSIFFPNRRTAVLKTKENIVVYATSVPKFYTAKNGIDFSTFLYVEPGDEIKIDKEKFDTGVFIDKNYMYSSDLSVKKPITREKYKELKKYKKDFEKERVESLKAVTINDF